MVKSKKVLCLFGNSVYYGHERSNVQVFTLLKELGMNLHVLTNKKGLAPQAEQTLSDHRIDYTPIRYPSWSDVRKPFGFIKSLRYGIHIILHNIAFLKELIRFKPDYIYIANDFMYMSLLPSFLLSRKRIIYRLGDKPLMTWLPFRILWQKFIVKRTYRFICISQFIKDKLMQAGRKIDRGDVVIYNYPPIRSKVEVEAIHFLKSTSDKEVVFSYLGQIIEIKGVKLFVQAAIEIAKRYPETKFLLAGDLKYDEKFSKEIIDMVKSSAFSESFVFLGAIDNIEDFFAKTDVLITPSIKEEPLGNVIVEAKKYSTPSIIFNSGGMPELIKHKRDGYVCTCATSEAIEEAMIHYLRDPEIIKDNGIAALESIEELKIGYDHFKSLWLNSFT